MTDTPSHFCPLPWTSLSFEPNGQRRICCYGGKGKGFPEGEMGSNLSKFNIKESSGEEFLKAVQNKFINGLSPEFCQNCFKVESRGVTSPRQMMLEKYNKETKEILGKKFKPQNVVRLEITLGNNCNLKCRMCGPYFSKPMAKDFEKLKFQYSKKDAQDCSTIGKMRLGQLTDDFRDTLLRVKEISFLGGEPLLSDLHTDILKYIASKSSLTPELFYNSNITVLPKTILEIWDRYNRINLECSIDAFGPLNSYIRYPSKWTVIDQNLKKLVNLKSKMPQLKVSICTTIQAYNLLNLTELFSYLLQFRHCMPVIPHPIMVFSPSMLSPYVLPKSLRKKALLELKSFFNSNHKILRQGKYKNTNLKNFELFAAHLESVADREESEKSLLHFLTFSHKFDKLRGESLFKVNPVLDREIKNAN